MGSKNWNSRSLGSKFKHKFFYTLISWFGLRPATAFLYVVVLYYSLLPSILRRSRPYLTRRFPHARGFTLWRHGFRLNLTFGMVLLERAALGITGRITAAPNSTEEADLARMLAEGKGLILLTAHVGGWQAAMSGLTKCGAKVNIVQLRDEGDVDRHYFEHNADCATPVLIDATDPVASLGAMSAALLRGEAVCMMGDRVRENDSLTVKSSLLGGTISVPASPYFLAGRLGCPLVVFFSPRIGSSHVVGRAYATIRVPADSGRDPKKLAAYAQIFTKAVEDFVNEFPYQFFNFYDLWDKG